MSIRTQAVLRTDLDWLTASLLNSSISSDGIEYQHASSSSTTCDLVVQLAAVTVKASVQDASHQHLEDCKFVIRRSCGDESSILRGWASLPVGAVGREQTLLSERVIPAHTCTLASARMNR
jgi:hypothetical protein